MNGKRYYGSRNKQAASAVAGGQREVGPRSFIIKGRTRSGRNSGLEPLSTRQRQAGQHMQVLQPAKLN